VKLIPRVPVTLYSRNSREGVYYAKTGPDSGVCVVRVEAVRGGPLIFSITAHLPLDKKRMTRTRSIELYYPTGSAIIDGPAFGSFPIPSRLLYIHQKDQPSLVVASVLKDAQLRRDVEAQYLRLLVQGTIW